MLEGHDISLCVVKVLRSRRLFRSMSHHLLRGFHEVSREGTWRQGNGGRKGGGGVYQVLLSYLILLWPPERAN